MAKRMGRDALKACTVYDLAPNALRALESAITGIGRKDIVAVRRPLDPLQDGCCCTAERADRLARLAVGQHKQAALKVDLTPLPVSFFACLRCIFNDRKFAFESAGIPSVSNFAPLLD